MDVSVQTSNLASLWMGYMIASSKGTHQSPRSSLLGMDSGQKSKIKEGKESFFVTRFDL